jgi:transposase-like protein
MNKEVIAEAIFNAELNDHLSYEKYRASEQSSAAMAIPIKHYIW